MPVTPSYPGVYIEEVASSVRPVIGVATGVTAFVGYVRTGPENRAVRVDTFGDFERRFGGVDRDSELSLAVQQFFRNGGAAALVVRVPRADARAASVTLLDKIGAGAKSALLLDAASTGAWGSGLLLDVDHDGVADATSFNLSVADTATGDTERFTGLSADPTSAAYAVALLNDPDRGSALVRARAGAAGAGRPVPSGTAGAAIGTPTVDAAKNYRLTVQPDRPTKPDPNDPSKTVPAVAPVTVTVLEKGDRLPSCPAGVAGGGLRVAPHQVAPGRPAVARCGSAGPTTPTGSTCWRRPARRWAGPGTGWPPPTCPARRPTGTPSPGCGTGRWCSPIRCWSSS